MPTYKLRVNGRDKTVDSWDPNQPLLYVLRDTLGFNAPKFGCGLGQCGACTVTMNGQAVRSCVTPVSKAAGQAITTLEGLGTPEKPNRLQAAFIAEAFPSRVRDCGGQKLPDATQLVTRTSPADPSRGSTTAA